MSDIKFELAGILGVFEDSVVGTRVDDPSAFMDGLADAVGVYDPAEDHVEGQHFVMLGGELFGTVSCGVGLRTADAGDYVLRSHRGRVDAYLRRGMAADIDSMAAVVYTRAAYLADPDVLDDADEVARISDSDCTHVLVAVLAGSGPRSELTELRLVSNLAGGNNAALQWSGDEIRENAVASSKYWKKYCVVAD